MQTWIRVVVAVAKTAHCLVFPQFHLSHSELATSKITWTSDESHFIERHKSSSYWFSN